MHGIFGIFMIFNKNKHAQKCKQLAQISTKSYKIIKNGKIIFLVFYGSNSYREKITCSQLPLFARKHEEFSCKDKVSGYKRFLPV